MPEHNHILVLLDAIPSCGLEQGASAALSSSLFSREVITKDWLEVYRSH